jgi:hypothetical protein
MKIQLNRLQKIRFTLLVGLIFFLTPWIFAQSDTLSEKRSHTSPLQISTYLETYYIYDFANPADHTRPDFLYSFNRHNEINLNLGLLKIEYTTNRVRGNLGLMAGTYANANLATEPGVLKNVFEAFVGVKVSQKKNLWVDAGIFTSHIGFESALGATTWNMTRGLLAENSPYYLSGAKISYTSDNQEWFISGLVMNGWQRIQRVPDNQLPAFGHQLTWTPTDKILLNSSSFIGNDYPESERRMRYFHNFYGQFMVNNRLEIITGFDIGMEQKFKESRRYNVWYSPIAIARFSATNKVALSGRIEYYSDKNEVIVSTGTSNGFQTVGYSMNLDYKITDDVLWRLEGRRLNSKDSLFTYNDKPSKNNFILGTSLSIFLK